MRWWKRGVSPSSASSSPGRSKSTPSSPHRPGRGGDAAGLVREPQRRLTRQRKLRHVESVDVTVPDAIDQAPAVDAPASSAPVSRKASKLDGLAAPARSSSSPLLMPQPLPLPDYAAPSPHRDVGQASSNPGGPHRGDVGQATSNLGGPHRGDVGQAAPSPGGRQLRSPIEAASRVEGEEVNGFVNVEPIGERFSPATVFGSRLAYPTACRSSEHANSPLSGSKFSRYRKALQDSNSVEHFRLNLPAKSAPASGLSSPVRSPKKTSDIDYFASTYDPSQGFKVWSAPEIPSSHVMTGFSYLHSPEKVVASPDCSPFYSPTVRTPGQRSRNPSAPPSPLHPKMFPENSAGWHDSNGNISVHPLPLPPVPATASQSGFAHQAAAKAEVPTVPNQWQKGKLIGSGTFGSVYLATNRHTGALCAMKEVNIIPDDPKSAECLVQLEQEINVLSQLKHPNIVQYYGSEMIEDRFYIYLEYVYPGSIQKYVREHFGAMTESVIRNFTRHILHGLAYLHGKKTVHRDIKGANLLVDAQGVVKLADFGTAKHLNGAMDALSLKGTPYWMAPEVVQATMNKDIGYDLSVDIWSLGCTIIEMFTGKHPWSGLEGAAAMFKVLHKDPPIPETLSSEGKNFLQKCFLRNPADRPTASMLLEHPFIRNSHHYNLHGSIQAFAGMKLVNNMYGSRERPKSKSESAVKAKRLSNGETSRSHPEISESAAIRYALDAIPSIISPPHFNQTASPPNGSSLNGLNGVHLANGSQHPHALPKPRG